MKDKFILLGSIGYVFLCSSSILIKETFFKTEKIDWKIYK